MSGKLRTWVAWAAAVITIVALELLAALVGSKIGVPVMLDVDPYTVHFGHGVEIESESITTAYGWGIHVLAILAAVATWYRIQRRPLSATAQAQFYGFLVGAALMTAGGVPLWLLFQRTTGLANTIGNLLELGLFAGAIFVGVRWAKRLQRQ